MLPALVMTAMLSSAPTQYAYDFFLTNKTVHAGVVVLELSGTTYRYGSAQAVNRDGHLTWRRRGDVFELSVDSRRWRGRVPATLALVAMSAEKGCKDVVDEVTRKLGTYCVTSREADVSRGTLFDKAVTVRLTAGVASEVVFPSDGSWFVRTESAELPDDPPDLTSEGFPVPGKGSLKVSPAVDARPPKLQQVTKAETERWFEAVRAQDFIFCTDFARAFLKSAGGGRAAMVHGFRVDDDVASPHAWVRVVTEAGPLELDPTFGAAVKPDAYLPLLYVVDVKDEQSAGALWLSFVNGTRTVSRRGR